ncbi:MAG: hypothetical protein AB7P04_07180 [Bacteriovoracia bacterium]
MKFSSLLILATSLGLSIAHADERKLYVGKNATEAYLNFRHTVEINSPRANEDDAYEAIEDQLQHLFGTMAVADLKAVPRGAHEITDVQLSVKDGKKTIVSYQYRGLIVVELAKRETPEAPLKSYTVILPNNPATIYRSAMVGRYNPCTDEHYQEEGDFWYFWSPAPANPKCRLKEWVHYRKVTGSLQRIKNTTRSFPEYERLTSADGVLRISLLMGMDDPDLNRDPNVSDDENALNFRPIKASLLERGYRSRIWSGSEINQVVPDRAANDRVYVEEFTKTFTRNEVTRAIRLRIFFGPSGIDEDSRSFHYFFKDSLANEAIMMYDGHSGLGGHLDLAAIEDQHGFEFAPNQKQYQIYFFNSCSSYTYYNSMYFGRKKTQTDPKGTKNLDVLNNGLSTYFSVMHDTNMALVRAVEAWVETGTRVSYQTLANQIDSDNLFSVNGDEDNPKE